MKLFSSPQRQSPATGSRQSPATGSKLFESPLSVIQDAGEFFSPSSSLTELNFSNTLNVREKLSPIKTQEGGVKKATVGPPMYMNSPAPAPAPAPSQAQSVESEASASGGGRGVYTSPSSGPSSGYKATISSSSSSSSSRSSRDKSQYFNRNL